MKLRSATLATLNFAVILSLFTSFTLADALRGTLVHEEIIRVAPDSGAAKLAEVGRGRELVVIDASRDWVHVEAILRQPSHDEGATEEEEEGKAITGWVSAKSLVTSTTQDGDRIIFGEAADSEDQASRRRGRRDAAQDAMRLYYRVYDLMPASPLAAEALYRAADIRWQIEAADAASRPSAKMRDPQLHHQIDEDYMRKVIKKYPGTKWADLAAYHLIDNKLCGDWEAQAKCPEQEAAMYMKYAEEHPQSPKAPEALYKAAWRYSALVAIYGANHEPKKADEASERSLNASKKLVAQYPNDVDWSSRAERLIYMVTNKLPTFGITVE
jgi:outer membrane protein assembly factor BamD (BamD/ComL family)